MFIPRAMLPESGNKYYIRKPTGYNPCIFGNKPYHPQFNVLPNCTGWAVARFNEIIGSGACLYLGSTNAENLIALAQSQGLAVLDRPTFGGCMVWYKGKPGNSADGAGHCAIVEGFNPDGSIVTSESGWNSRRFMWTQTRSGANWSQSSAYRFAGCIVNPAAYPAITRPGITLKQGMNGDEIKWLQIMLSAHGYYYELGKNPIDGSFGNLTERAVKKFQLRWKLTPDGVCGKFTKDALERGFAI